MTLEAIKGKLEKVVKKNDLDQLSQSLVKKSDIELIVTSIVTKLMDNFKKELDEKLEKKFIEKTGKQQKAIEELTKENEQLREIAAEQRRTINSLKMVVDDNVTRTKEAIRMCNYNEQYSRKFNIKIMNYQKKEGEDLRSDFINKIAKEKLKVTIQPDEIQAIHRIRGKEGQAPPAIVKLINTEVKSRVMRVKKNLPKEGLRLVDDISKQNMALITRLRSSQHFESVWYFNCAVHAKTLAGSRYKFDINDDIEKKIGKKRI